MKAIRIHEFGPPEVLKLEEVARPAPSSGELLIKVYASAINPIDLKIRDGAIMNRLHVRFEMPITLGWDVAGIVTEVGNAVTTFKKGDAVYGIPNFPGQGSYAEYVAADARKFALKPQSISFNEAAAVPVSAVAAWDGIVNGGQVMPGQRVLIHGASGNVGRFAVQLAKSKGAYVIGTASEANRAIVLEIGADEVIDYRNQDLVHDVRDLDLVFDAVGLGPETQLKSIALLKENGIFATVQGRPLTEEVKQALHQKNATAHVIYGEDKIHAWLSEIAKLIDANALRISINSIYSLDQVVEAHREAETRKRSGKIIIEVRNQKQHEPLQDDK